MEVIGIIKVIGNDEQVSTSFVKRDIVVTTEEQYPQHIQVQFVQDKVDLLDKFKIGETVKIGINLRGREWTNPQGEVKYFNTIQGWKIEKLNDVGTPTSSGTPNAPSTPAPSTPATAKPKLVMIDATHTYEAYIKANWTDALLVEKGKAKWEYATAAPAPVVPAAEDNDDLPF